MLIDSPAMTHCGAKNALTRKARAQSVLLFWGLAFAVFQLHGLGHLSAPLTAGSGVELAAHHGDCTHLAAPIELVHLRCPVCLLAQQQRHRLGEEPPALPRPATAGAPAVVEPTGAPVSRNRLPVSRGPPSAAFSLLAT